MTNSIFKKQTLLAYADVGRRLKAIRNAYLALEAEAAKIGLKINEQKTKKKNDCRNRTIFAAGQTVAFGDMNFEVVSKFLYLGALMTPKNDIGLEIHRRIQTTNRWFCGLRKHLRSSHLARQKKLTIRPVLLYGSETCVLTKRKENRLPRF
jgi:hypothetical protein